MLLFKMSPNEVLSISSVSDLAIWIRTQDGSKPFWYRGQPDATWKLIPRIGRTHDGVNSENIILARFKQNGLSCSHHYLIVNLIG